MFGSFAGLTGWGVAFALAFVANLVGRAETAVSRTLVSSQKLLERSSSTNVKED